MANFKFEGDIESISARQLEYIGSILEEHGYKNETVLVQPAGDNYVANVKRIIVEKNGETFKMIAKIAPTKEAFRAMMNTGPIFRNEHIMYTEVLPALVDLQKSADVPENERLRYAACYGSLSEEPNEVILLEDLGVSGFVMLDRFKSLTDECIKIVLKNFAILHSSCYALKKLEPETYAALLSKIINLWDFVMDGFEQIIVHFEALENDIITIVDNKYKRYFKGAIVQMITQAKRMANIDKGSRYSIIQQGPGQDSWTNNIMFKMKDEEAVECCMIDYQLSKESNPVADILYMIFNCTDYAARAKHYHQWIDYYHTELDKHLSNYGLKANYVFSRDQLDAELRRYGKMTFGQLCMLASILSRETADAAKVKEAMEQDGFQGMFSKVSLLDERTISRFKDRLEGTLNSFLELGYL